MSRIVSKARFRLDPKQNAFKYQAEAFHAIKDLEYSAIFHEQGLGKTKIAIDLLLYWLTQKNIDTVMIVTKKQLVKNWQDEFSFHTYITPKILTNNKTDNYYVLNSATKVIITNFETISTDKDRIKLFLKCRNVAIIIDESTKLKNPDSQLTKNFFELSTFFKIRTIMTGTPVANRPYDLWAQIYFLDQGKSLGSNFSDFKRNTDLSNDLSENEASRESFEQEVSSIYDKISSFSVRETKKTAGIALPQKIFQTVYAPFETIQYKMYNTVIKDLMIELVQDGEIIVDDDSVALKRLLRLLQIASNPRLINDDYQEQSGKEIELEKILGSIISKGEKCIVWSTFIENVDYFAKKFKQYCPRKIHGGMTIEERNRSVDLFKHDDNCKILFATPQAAKEGLTLTVANHVVFYDRGFNLDDYLQAQDRIHRISQKKTCYVYNLMLRDSVDDWINNLLEAKQYAAFLAQGDITKLEYQELANYSYCDLIKEILQQGDDINGSND
jgi:SNF2 family DNA or RNA helicase